MKGKKHEESPPPPPAVASETTEKDTVFNLDESFEKKIESLKVEDPYINATIGDRYLLHEKIGSGGMGSVYRATHVLMDKPVAIKLISAELTHLPQVVGRFEREARSASRLSDPHCITVTDFGRAEDGTLYLVMELMKGESLDDLLSRKGVLSYTQAVSLTRQILKGLSHAHAAGIVHRDLKPANVMLIKHGGRKDFVKVFDFGIAKIADNTGMDHKLTQQGMIVGTPAYLSPEQALGEDADNRADLYTMGIMLFEMLVGDVPFRGDAAVDVVTAHISAAPPPLPMNQPYPIGLREILQRALEKKPADRFQSATEFIEALDALNLNKLEVGRIPQDPRERKRSYFALGMLVFVGIVAAATAFGAKLFLERQELERSDHEVVHEPADGENAEPFIGADEKEIAALVEKGEEQIRSGIPLEAIATLRKALTLNPELAPARLLLGHALFLAGKRGDAMESYEGALSMDKGLAEDERLVQYLEEGLKWSASQTKAAAMLAAFGGDKGIALLTEKANSALAEREERGAARKALIAIGRGDAIDWLATLTADFNDYKACKKRHQIVQQMEETGDPGFLPLLELQLPAKGRWNKANKCIQADVERVIKILRAVKARSDTEEGAPE